MSDFGKRLAKLRESRGWSQQELAERSGVPYTAIYKVERGVHKEPRVSVAAKLARTLGVPLDVLANTYGEVIRDDDSERLAAAVA